MGKKKNYLGIILYFCAKKRDETDETMDDDRHPD